MKKKQPNKTAEANEQDFLSITPERWAELDKMVTEFDELQEKVNLVPLNPIFEQYISDRYPLALLYARFDIQDLASTYFETLLSEDEICDVRASFYDMYPDEIELTIRDAIEQVIEDRNIKKHRTTK